MQKTKYNGELQGYEDHKKKRNNSTNYEKKKHIYSKNKYNGKIHNSRENEGKKKKETNPKNLKPGYYFCPVGGTNEIGMNLNLFGIVTSNLKQHWIIIDFGVSILNKHGINVEFASAEILQQVHIDGIVITHAHEDHIGAPLLAHSCFNIKNRPIKIYASHFALAILKNKSKKLIRYTGSSPLEVITNESNELTQPFYDLIEVEANTPFYIGPFKITLLYITHSIPETNMIKLEFSPEEGQDHDYTMLHTADWKNDSHPMVGDPANLPFISEHCLKPDVLLCDSTNSWKKGSTPSEKKTRQYLNQVINVHKNVDRIFVSFFSTNVARLKIMIDMAEKHKRTLLLYGTSMVNMYEIATNCGIIKSSPYIKTEFTLSDKTSGKYLIACTGSQGEPGAVLEKLCDERFRYCKLRKDDVIIFSSKVIPGNEKIITQLKNNLLRKNVVIVDEHNHGMHIDRYMHREIKVDGEIHVSGHPCQEDIYNLVNLCKPKSIIPIHGDALHTLGTKYFINSNFPNIYCLQVYNGAFVKLNSQVSSNIQKPSIIGSINVKKAMMDGNQLITEDDKHFYGRKQMGENGIVLLYKEYGRIKLFQVGMINTADEDLHVKFKNIEKYIIKEHNNNIYDSIQLIIKNIRRKCSQIFGKRPFVSIIRPQRRSNQGASYKN